MEFIDGVELKDKILNPVPLIRGPQGGVTVDETINIAIQIAEGLGSRTQEGNCTQGYKISEHYDYQ